MRPPDPEDHHRLHVVSSGLIAPTHAKAANEIRQHTLVPCVFTTGRVPKIDDVKTAALTMRNYHRILHVMTKGADKPLCRCDPPDGYHQLYGLSQTENQALMELDRQAPQWHRLMWCSFCTSWARLLVNKAA